MNKDIVISFIIPTYNAESYLKRCIQSILDQKYPRSKYEIIVAEGGSTDNTVNILKNYPVKIVQNKKRIAEYGKYIAYKKAKGRYICLIDSDNVIASNEWLERLIKCLIDNPGLVGIESNYLIAKDFTAANQYATMLVIADPLARMLAPKPSLIKYKNNLEIKTFSVGHPPVAGANGFIWNKKIINKYLEDKDNFTEVQLMNEISRDNEISIANIQGIGIYHYYCTNIKDFLKKRQKIAKKHLNRRHENDNTTWVDNSGKVKIIFSAIYMYSIVGPLLEALKNMSITKNRNWLLHPLFCFLSINIYAYYGFKDWIG